ncbi:MAG TPA: DUF4440 domain-containing protein [Gemmatimonadales bacterium]
MRASSWCLLVGLAAAAACQRPSTGATGSDDPSAARAAINEANAKGVVAFNSRDRAAWLAMLDEHTTEMHLGTPDVVGRSAVDSSLGANWEAGRDSVVGTWKADSIEVHGDYAYEVGRGMFLPRPRGPAATPDTIRTRYITFWHRGPDGQWRVSRDFTVRVPRPTK